MAHISLYRKYRSQSFGDLVGQNHVVQTLQNGIESGRIAHAYLFTGPRGTGKTSSARLLAKALCCEKGPRAEPCNECDLCISITEGSSLDVHEFDAASESGVDDIRDTIVDRIEYLPALARYKVYIIDEVHDLSSKAFDALLKTIEEPPEHVIFILATTEYSKVPPTIRSRCQKYEFHRGSMQDLVSRLKYVAEQEKCEIEPAALGAIAQMADGGYRDALTLLEQALITSDGKITLQHVYDQLGLVAADTVDKLLLAMRDSDIPAIVTILNELTRVGRDPRAILESLMHRLADLTRASYGLDLGHSNDATSDAIAHETAAKLGKEQLLNLRSALAEAHKVIRDITLPRLWLEAELVRIGRPAVVITAPSPAAAPVAKAVAATPTPTPASGDDDLDRARAAWSKLMAKLPANAPITLKLQGSSVATAKGNQIQVTVTGKMIFDWLTEKPERQNFVLKTLGDIGIHDWKITYHPAKNGKATTAEVATVELPLEGPQLHEAAQDILTKEKVNQE